MRTLPLAGAALLGFVAAGSTLGCGSSSSSPASPTPSPTATASVATLRIIGPPNSYIVVGDTAQFTATATFTDGATASVTNEAIWSTADPSIFQVTAGGKVTALKVGSADIRATYRSVSDRDYTTAQPFLTFKAYGTVTEAAPDFGALPGARVEITPSPTAGLFSITDAAGDFAFLPLKGGVYTLTVSHDGFIAQTRQITLTRDFRADFPLRPTPPPGATARCKDKSWSYVTTAAAACTRNGGISYTICPGPLCS